MSDDRWHTVLVLGGIRSGKSAFAEALVADAPRVRYVATAAGGEDDPEWLARIEEHQRRRPQSWSTEETGADPARLTELLAEAKPDDTLLVDDLGGWVAGLLDPARQPNDDEADVVALATAVGATAARVVFVSPEVGLALVPTTPVGRAFTDALGSTNQALAEVCDRVALVVAGRPVWLKTGTGTLSGDIPDLSDKRDESKNSAVEAADRTVPIPAPSLVSPVAATEVATVAEVAEVADVAAAAEERDDATIVLPVGAAGVVFEPGMDLPLPDGDAGPDARERLTTVDFAGTGLGRLSEAVEFAAATQGTVTPQPWSAVRVLLLSGRHAGGAEAGDDPEDVERRVAQVENGEGVLSRLAGSAGADIAVLRTAPAAAIEDGPATTDDEVERGLQQGWLLADAAATAGKDLLVIASIGVGTDAAATAISAATTGAEAVAILPRVLLPGGVYDDESWMTRMGVVRDALHRIRQEPRGAKDILRELGGPDLAVATGALLGAAARRLPVVVDGPVGIAAGLIARDLASQTRHWSLLVDAGDLELVRQGGDVLGLNPVLELGLGLGEGSNALAALPLLRTAIGLASAVGVHPAMLSEHGDAGLTDLIVPNDDEDVDFAEPVPDGPGPASTTPE
ncbi:bifunctional adenosylcobinamide kinase/adenosylcobinamide-phosphate guanylyltransferase [Actinoplanes solisilvae]|uniref:bifunctional adenosylcobinamide kinase/adenosylcobinamide-phosphate guanylyltransferase n=1 Tax=Actinoplanes solisilvae TaxID=2486853 RepID=UPI000FDCDD1E|nr:bifunctional adenosylcobinamide kinase/adenosylcobinamide-phosphate guanylyltransferase [Actinoplanes solisilvae]